MKFLLFTFTLLITSYSIASQSFEIDGKLCSNNSDIKISIFENKLNAFSSLENFSFETPYFLKDLFLSNYTFKSENEESSYFELETIEDTDYTYTISFKPNDERSKIIQILIQSKEQVSYEEESFWGFSKSLIMNPKYKTIISMLYNSQNHSSKKSNQVIWDKKTFSLSKQEYESEQIICFL